MRTALILATTLVAFTSGVANASPRSTPLSQHALNEVYRSCVSSARGVSPEQQARYCGCFRGEVYRNLTEESLGALERRMRHHAITTRDREQITSIQRTCTARSQHAHAAPPAYAPPAYAPAPPRAYAPPAAPAYAPPAAPAYAPPAVATPAPPAYAPPVQVRAAPPARPAAPPAPAAEQPIPQDEPDEPVVEAAPVPAPAPQVARASRPAPAPAPAAPQAPPVTQAEPEAAPPAAPQGTPLSVAELEAEERQCITSLEQSAPAEVNAEMRQRFCSCTREWTETQTREQLAALNQRQEANTLTAEDNAELERVNDACIARAQEAAPATPAPPQRQSTPARRTTQR
jgi:hypothetical protein